MDASQRVSPAGAVLLASVMLALLPLPSLAEPVAQASSHAWRGKSDPRYVGYTGERWERDFGVIYGRCNIDAIGSLLDGPRIGKGDERAVAILSGAGAGAVIGARIGRDLEDSDRACIGHALELARDNRTVFWKNNATGASYELTPLRGLERNDTTCREFATRVTVGVNTQVVHSVACRRGAGDWEFLR